MAHDDESSTQEPADQVEEAWALVQQGDLDQALHIARRSLEYAELPDAHNLIGFIMMSDGRVDAAEQHYRRAIELDEFFLDPALNLAELQLSANRAEDALRVLESVSEHAETPDAAAEVVLLKIDAQLQLNHHDAASALLSEIPSGPFENPELDFLVGRAHFDLGDVDGAAPRIEAAASSGSLNPDVSYYLGLVLEARGDRAGATIAFLRSRELEEDTPPPPWTTGKAVFERSVRAALKRLEDRVSDALDGALVVVAALPGREIIAEGVDPRSGAFADDLQEGKVGRLFIYQRCCERSVARPEDVEDAIVNAIEREVVAVLTQ